jgi:hypothetical protein
MTKNKRYVLVETGTGHSHAVTLDSDGNGISSSDAGHNHRVEDGQVMPAFGTDNHVHNLKRLEGFEGFGPLIRSNRYLVITIVLLTILTLIYVK